MMNHKDNTDGTGGKGREETEASARRGAAPAAPAAAGSLELSENSVTGEWEELSRLYRLTKCRCDCWFCPDCCLVKGLQVRAELTPILATSQGILLISLTVDPTLFESPEAALLYMLKRRCLGRTVQDLRRGGFLHSDRYFAVVEWQKETEQAHFHILLDASFIPHEALLASWSKHRPAGAGPVEGKRPGFGTAFISRRRFATVRHASNYATKYLTKFPKHGFPAWVLAMGKTRRVRRYSTSKKFWGRTYPPPSEPQTTRHVNPKSYAERVADCGKTVNLVAEVDDFSRKTGEVVTSRGWLCELDLEASVIQELPLLGCERTRGMLSAQSARGAVRELARKLNREVRVIRSGMLFNGREDENESGE